LGGGDVQNLTGPDLVGFAQLVFVRLEDPHMFVCIAMTSWAILKSESPGFTVYVWPLFEKSCEVWTWDCPV